MARVAQAPDDSPFVLGQNVGFDITFELGAQRRDAQGAAAFYRDRNGMRPGSGLIGLLIERGVDAVQRLRGFLDRLLHGLAKAQKQRASVRRRSRFGDEGANLGKG